MASGYADDQRAHGSNKTEPRMGKDATIAVALLLALL